MHGELKQVADLALFAKIVQTGGISRCAADLGMERTTVSRRLGSLERNLGVKLLDRTPKHIAVTDAGRRCLEQCELLLESAPIVVGAPPDIIDRFLDSSLGEFANANPGLTIERMPVTLWTDDAIEAVDIGIALAPVTFSGGWSNTIGHVRQSVFASADYAERHGPVHTPFDLEMHDCIVESADRERHSWRFGSGQKPTTVTVRSKFVVSSLLEAREATLAGLGISRLPQYLCESYLRSGQLIDLMPAVESSGREVVVISPRQRQRKTGTASLRMHLENVFRKNAA